MYRYRQPALHKLKEKARFPVFYVASFLAALHYFLVVYINSSFLKTFVGEDLVGLFYIAGATISILLFLSVSRLLSKFGNYRAMVIFTAVEASMLLLIALIQAPTITPILFMIHFAVAPIIFYNLDIFLEGSTQTEEDTGQVRGTMLTMFTTAFVLAPLMVGYLVDTYSFPIVYTISALLLVPFMALISLEFRRFLDPKYHVITPSNLGTTIIKTWRDVDVRNIIFSHLIMRIYMSWLAVYIPIYLNGHIGFSWSAIGTLLVIAFLPYFLEFPIGKLADAVLGEKEMLILGFVIMALGTLAIPLVDSGSFYIWAAVLLVSRLGCAFVEMMTESYFFKHIDGDDTELLSFFRLLRPLSYILSIGTAVIALSFMDLRTTFFVLAVILLLGLRFAVPIHDTK